MRIAFAVDGQAAGRSIPMTRGDNLDVDFAVRLDDDVSPVDLTNAVVQMAIGSAGVPLMTKRSYDPAQLDISAGGGRGSIHLTPSDTATLSAPSCFQLDVQIDRPTGSQQTSGAATFDGTDGVIIAGADFSKIRVGSFLTTTSPARAAVITAVDVGTNTVHTSGYTWAAGSSAVAVFDGLRKTPRSLTVQLEVALDVVV